MMELSEDEKAIWAARRERAIRWVQAGSLQGYPVVGDPADETAETLNAASPPSETRCGASSPIGSRKDDQAP
jgi:hypothetical protein